MADHQGQAVYGFQGQPRQPAAAAAAAAAAAVVQPQPQPQQQPQPQPQQPAAAAAAAAAVVQPQPPAAAYVFHEGDITNPYAMTWDAYFNRLKQFLDATYPAVRQAPAQPAAAAAQPAAAAAAPAGLKQQAREAANGAVAVLTGPGPRTFINGRGGIPDVNGRAILDAIKAVLPAGNEHNAQRAATNDAARTYWNTHLDAGGVPPRGAVAQFVVADYKTAIVNAIN